jgi:hypothetical protein
MCNAYLLNDHSGSCYSPQKKKKVSTDHNMDKLFPTIFCISYTHKYNTKYISIDKNPQCVNRLWGTENFSVDACGHRRHRLPLTNATEGNGSYGQLWLHYAITITRIFSYNKNVSWLPVHTITTLPYYTECFKNTQHNFRNEFLICR